MAALGEHSLLAHLQTCRQRKDLRGVQQLLAYMRRHHLDTHPLLGNHLVSVLADCQDLREAELILQQLPHRTASSWSSLISGYITCGDLQHAFHLYHNMLQDRVRPSSHTYTSLLKACAKMEDIKTGRKLRADIALVGLEQDPFIGSSLIDMYAKCGSLAEAREVFDQLSVRNVVTWTSMIAGYAEHGYGEEALSCFENMQLDNVSPDDVTFLCSVKACGCVGALERGRQLHGEVVKMGFETDVVIGSTVLDMYSKCGSLAEAQDVFDKLRMRNVVSWTALIAGYVEYGLCEKALSMYKQMQPIGISPNGSTYLCILKTCDCTEALKQGHQLHTEITLKGLEKDVCICNTLIDMFNNCSSLAEACHVFESLSIRTIVSWTALISGYVEHGRGEEAMAFFDQMQLDGVSPTSVTFVCSLRACANLEPVERGQKLHGEVLKKGLEKDPSVGNAIVGMYSKYGLLTDAQHVFDALPVKHAVSWNALISGYAQHGLCEEALSCFELMQLEGVFPDDATFLGILKGFVNIDNFERGWMLLAEIIKRGLENNNMIGSVMLNIYSSIGLLAEARETFNKLQGRDEVAWNTLMVGYAENGLGEEALNCFEQMQLEGLLPDPVTFVASLKACGITGALEKGQYMHAEMTMKGMETDLYVGNSLVDMYAKCQWLAEAQKVLDQLPLRDRVSWASLISGYTEHGLHEEVLNCFGQMHFESLSADIVTYVRCLKACGTTGALQIGQCIHNEINKFGSERDILVGNTLVDMYSECASIAEAKHVFNKLPARDVVTWNTMIKGFGENHEGIKAMQCFEDMKKQAVKPNAITFACLLAACSHASLVGKGLEYFKIMIKEYRIEPVLDHYICLVDLLGRSGLLRKAESYAEALESSETSVALLTACKLYGKVEQGLKCFERLATVNTKDAASYLLMTDIYASTGNWGDARRIDELRKHLGAQKRLARALIEVDGRMHEFLPSDHERPMLGKLVNLRRFLNKGGYIPFLDVLRRHIFGQEVTCYDYSTHSFMHCEENLANCNIFEDVQHVQKSILDGVLV